MRKAKCKNCGHTHFRSKGNKNRSEKGCGKTTHNDTKGEWRCMVKGCRCPKFVPK